MRPAAYRGSVTERPRPEARSSGWPLDALRGLRQDLFHDAFAYRPLPPHADVDGPLTRRLPERLREYARLDAARAGGGWPRCLS